VELGGNERMTILLINYEYPPIGAGAANATRHIAKALVELGHTAVVLTAGYRDTIGYSVEDGGVHVHRLPSARKSVSSSNPHEMLSFVWHAWRALGSIVQQHSPNRAILFFSIPCGLLGPTLRNKCKIPYIVALRGGDVPGMESGMDWVHTLLTPIRRRVLRQATAVIANSRGLAEASEKADPIPVSVIPNGVDTEFFRPPAEPPKGPFTFLFVGRFQQQKNLPVVINAFAEAFAGSDVRLKLVGDGPQRAELESLVQHLGIGSQVSFLPWQDKHGLLQQYQSAHCLINYSLYEGMPNVVLEAMACGLPVILSDIMGHEELVSTHACKQLVDTGRVDELLRTMYEAVHEVSSSMPYEHRNDKFVPVNWTTIAQHYLDCTGLR
jgi:glycosyltransferase involved in cell wall biosynthesis